MNRIWLKRTGLFVFMLAVMFGLMLLRGENAHERAYKAAQLAPGKTVSCTVDLGRQGVLKSWLNPNIATLYLRLRADDRAQLTCEGTGMTMMLSQGTKKGLWPKLGKHMVLKKVRGSIPVNVELYVDREALQQYHVASGNIYFYEGEKLYSTVAIEVINSRANNTRIER